MGYDRIRFRAIQVAERILEERPFTSTKEKLIEVFIEAVQWAKKQQLPNQPELFPTELQQIQELIVHYFNLEGYDIWERTRYNYIVRARRWLWYWWRKKLDIPFLEMSKYCGYSHSTIIAGIRKIEEDLQIYSDVKRCYIELKTLMESIA